MKQYVDQVNELAARGEQSGPDETIDLRCVNCGKPIIARLKVLGGRRKKYQYNATCRGCGIQHVIGYEPHSRKGC